MSQKTLLGESYIRDLEPRKLFSRPRVKMQSKQREEGSQATLLGGDIEDQWVDYHRKVHEKRKKRKLFNLKDPSPQTRMDGKSFSQLAAIKQLRGDIEWLWQEIQWIRKVLRDGDKDIIVEITLSVQRYAGRGLPWYLHPENLPSELDGYEDMPDIRDYDIGSYWTGENIEETKKFIIDRMKWALKEFQPKLELKMAEMKELRKISAW